ncbi:MAG TPA: hypothetical protein VN948_16015 [Terriglobales bacterium]|nr:hypothetical protein [Terriglobales bacterium]
MKIFLVVAITVTILGGYAFSHIVSERQAAAQRSATTKPETPFFCDRTALTPEQRKRQQELGKTLGSSVLGIQELPDGFEFEFPSDPSNYQALTEFTPLERACCPFFDVSIRLEREGGKLWWRLTGREGVKQFIHAEFSSWIKR